MTHRTTLFPVKPASSQTWQQLIVARLAATKRSTPRLSFNVAWSDALRTVSGVPPRTGEDKRTDGETLAAAFHRYCRDAYDDTTGPIGGGNGPSLRYFRTGMLDDDGPAQTTRGMAA